MELLRDERAQKLWDLAKPTKAKFERVMAPAGLVGSVVGKGIGLVVGGLLVVIVLLSLLIALGCYTIGSALARWLEEQRIEYRRKKISQRESYEIAESQNWKCYYGGMQLQKGFHIDHKNPVSDIHNFDADPDEIEDRSNKVASCPNHNLKKGRMNEQEFREWMKANPQERCYTELGE